MKKGGRKVNKPKVAEPEPSQEEQEVSQFELGAIEKDCCKQNFQFYDAEKRGYVERFELPMLLQMCGYNLTDARIQ